MASEKRARSISPNRADLEAGPSAAGNQTFPGRNRADDVTNNPQIWASSTSRRESRESQQTEPKFPYVEKLKSSGSLRNQLHMLIECDDNKIDTPLDVKKYTMFVDEGSTKLSSGDHFADIGRCREFLERLEPSTSPQDRTTFLLFEGITMSAIDILAMLGVPGSFLVDHILGVREPPSICSKKLRSSLAAILESFGPKSRNKSSDRHTPDYTWTVDPVSRNRIPLSHSFHLDWSRVASIKKSTRELEVDVHGNLQLWPECVEIDDKGKSEAKMETSYIPTEFQDPPDVPISPYKPGKRYYRPLRIHRPYQAITLSRAKSTWMVAAEERISRLKVVYKGWDIVIVLFDDKRQIYPRNDILKFPHNRWEPLISNHGIAPDDHERPESTRELFVELLASINRASSMDSISNCEVLLIEGLCLEYWDVLMMMKSTIDKIDREMSDQITLQENVLVWQKLLSNWRPLLSQMRANIRSLGLTLKRVGAAYTTGLKSDHKPIIEDIGEAIMVQEEIIQILNHVVERSDKTFQAMMSSMSIIESQQAIIEANSVGKLTELAFLFIPITFAATFYSMEVEGLEPTLSKFFLLAVLLLSAAYGIRLLIMSRARKDLMAKLNELIYTSRGISRGSSIPTSFYAAYFIGRSKRVIKTFGEPIILLIWGAIIPPLLFYAKNLAFKIIGSILSVIVVVWLEYDTKTSWSIVGLPVTIGIYSILAITLETKFKTALKISISVGIASLIAAIFFSLLVLRNRLSIKSNIFHGGLAVTGFCCLVLTPSILIATPWSSQPPLTEWQQGLVTIGLFDLYLLSFFLVATRNARRFTPFIRFFYGALLLLNNIIGVPIVFIWFYYQTPPFPRATQIIITGLAIWVGVLFVVLGYIRRVNEDYRNFDEDDGLIVRIMVKAALDFYFSLPVLISGILIIFIFCLWFGDVKSLEGLSTDTKAGLTMLCSWIAAFFLYILSAIMIDDFPNFT